MPLYVNLMYAIMIDRAVRKRHKALLSAGFLYALSPVDLVPGVIPVVGQLDDAIVILGTLLKVLRKIPPAKRAELLSGCGLRFDTVESDIAAAKALALYLATRPVAFAGDALAWTGKSAGQLVRGCYDLLHRGKR